MRRLKYLPTLLVFSILVQSCKPKPAAEKPDLKDSITTDMLIVAKTVDEEKNREVFFKALGTEPFWNIEITNDSIKFTTPEVRDNFRIVYKEPKKAMDANIILYEATSDSLSLKVTIQQGKCSDGMSDNEFNYKVKVSYKKTKDAALTELAGCGNYIVDYRLHDIWVLEELEGKKAVIEDFQNNLPNLEINSNEARFSGFGGCNRISGKLFAEKNLLRFTDIILTRMFCGENNKENQFVKALQSTTRFEIKNNRLYLFNPEGTKAVFKKID